MADQKQANQIVTWGEPPDGWIWNPATGKWEDPDDGSDSDDSGTGVGGGSGNVSLEQEEFVADFDPCTDEGSLETKVRAYVSPAELNYNVSMTATGTITPLGSTTSEFADTLTFRMGTTARARKPISDPSWAWEGPILNSDGETVSPPPVTFDGTDTFSIPEGSEVYGNLRVTATETYDLYGVTVNRRAEVDSNNEKSVFDNTFIAVWSGGARELVLQAPEISGRCRVEVNPDDDDGSGKWKLQIWKNKCNNQVTRHNIVSP